MKGLQQLSIKTKLIAMMMLSASIGIVAMAVAISINEAVSMHQDIEAELSTLAQIIGSRSTGSLTFNDPKTANENLHALAIKKEIIYAAIFQEEGLLFAEYTTPAMPYLIEQHLINQQYTWLTQLLALTKTKPLTGVITVVNDIYFEQQKIGHVVIKADMSLFLAKMTRYLNWVIITLIGCFTLSLVVSSHLHKLISLPILNLQKVTSKVAESDDYSVRITNKSADELGQLINSFNSMLEQIEIRDQKLAKYRKHLEGLIDERTDELTEANNRRIQWLENMARFLKHELKNASIGIKSSLELIQRRSQQPSINVYLERANKSLNYMDVLLASVSHASSLEAMIYKEPLIAVNLGHMVKVQVDEYKSLFPEYCIIDDIACDATILGNSDRLRQLLDNLVNNAFDHCLNDTPITIRLQRQHLSVELSVANQGVSLPKDKEKMFDLFVSLREAGQWKK
ncbi:sensor histidine kinase [Methylocucumis oryzae]|uniref:histidine kinase n=1 Tax=Methylocucumis oryzae TaxID=1632867 RepID=A0A0F3IGT9_9GAMM|nr:CHASE sensor domain-containing protein [Methylocucumis oryzae]KJV05976.1 hypothetical protein VZ94_14360 [Methylocucumis oryzae]